MRQQAHNLTSEELDAEFQLSIRRTRGAICRAGKATGRAFQQRIIEWQADMLPNLPKSFAAKICQSLGARLRLAGWNAGATPLRTVFHSGCAVCSENRLFSGTLPVTWLKTNSANSVC